MGILTRPRTTRENSSNRSAMQTTRPAPDRRAPILVRHGEQENRHPRGGNQKEQTEPKDPAATSSAAAIPHNMSTRSSTRSSYYSAAQSIPEDHGDEDRAVTHRHPNRGAREPCMHNFHYARLKVGEIVNHPKVQLFIVVLIATNALMMGIATFDFVKNDPSVSNAFEITDQVFLILFTVELCAQFIFHGWRLFQDGWLIFDTIIIVTSWSAGEAQIIRSFRIFRALRLITRVQVMQNLILALFSVMPRMFAIGILLFLVSYIFAVMFTQLFKDLYPVYISEDYFGRIDDTFFTLFQIMTLDGWSDIAREVMAVYSWAWLPFVIFVIVTGFVVVNLIIAVICDAISALHHDEKAKLHGSNVPHATTEQESEDEDHMDIREKLTSLEQNVDELAIMQEHTLQTMAALSQQLAQTNRNLLLSRQQRYQSPSPPQQRPEDDES